MEVQKRKGHSLRLQRRTYFNWIRVTPERKQDGKARTEEEPGLGQKVPRVSNSDTWGISSCHSS